MDDAALKSLLDTSKTVAIVGLSTDPEKTSSKIAEILIGAGYDVIPVHPKATEILGRTAYPTLSDIPFPVDIVDVFRASADTPPIAQQAVAIGAKTLWLQLGIASEESRAIAEAGGLTYLEDICIGETTKRLGNRAAAA